MRGTDVVTNDGDKLGTVLEDRDGFVIVESGHVFKSKHAIPREFIHEQGDGLIATVTKDVVMESPKINGDGVDEHAILRHYGLEVPFEVDPDPDAPMGSDQPPDAHRNEIAYERPVVRDRQPNAADPGGATANMTDENRTGP
jgi:hypothetical protein